MSRRTSQTKRIMGMMTSATAFATLITTAQSIEQNPNLWIAMFLLIMFSGFLMRG